MVKIISGSLKGRKISVPERVRPTPARVREAVFQMVDVKEKEVCDLFFGSGAMGIESISRGAKNVVFVDKSARNAAKLRKVMEGAGVEAKVIVTDAAVFVKNYPYIFDVVFMDPPYNKGIPSKIMPHISNIIKDGGILVMELSKFEDIQENGLKSIKAKKYGDTKIVILKKEKK